METASPLHAPLCPAGHLPLKGGDWQLHRLALLCNRSDWRKPSGRPISTLEGEMSGRTEGGAKERGVGGGFLHA
jgi:hypothetical protein